MQGVTRNEIVDQHAKEAALEPQGSQKPDNLYIRLATAAKRRIRREEKPNGQHHGSQRKRAALIELPKKTPEYWSDLRKATASILMQLRTVRIGLAPYLHRRESVRRSCNLGNQTVSYMLPECPLLQDERNWMRNARSLRRWNRSSTRLAPSAARDLARLWPNL